MKTFSGECVRIRAIINESRMECCTLIIFTGVKFIKKGKKIRSRDLEIHK